MSEPLLKKVQALSPCGLHQMAYWEWGQADNPRVLVCVHGLSRQGRDFDAVARRLSDRYRVICPDVVGRGESDWLGDPRNYQLPQYVSDMVTLLARLGVSQVDWLGTSMGGLIGLALAAMPSSPVGRLILNDVGPTIEFVALQRIAGYLGRAPQFENCQQGAEYLRGISEGFGPHTDEQWLQLSRAMFKADGDRCRLHYDPRIGQGLAGLTPELAKAGEAQLWAAYDAVRCPTLLLRGTESDLLSAATAQAMTLRGPRARVVEFAHVGHAPTLVTEDQIAVVEAFLEEGRR
ncbi:alpha/beta fold hydrolase [Roseateles depolymerans]|uniref:Alpha/beta hydrolase n=1 Tax=Roseateles depolymerans TaxID=76731 RepID=A0A0U3D2L3_9BURK|nr:alpha/beta hydrolase [Roseateles depolymerans]ALV07846.1 alpha/beta hydrolase [Roseateles depolymerans]REG21932.1 pimeloyl-ACP methyl ester carboxylesterase [Roseateles depolymerans]